MLSIALRCFLGIRKSYKGRGLSARCTHIKGLGGLKATVNELQAKMVRLSFDGSSSLDCVLILIQHVESVSSLHIKDTFYSFAK